MANKSLLTHMKSELEVMRRQMRDAAADFRIPDDKMLELRADARRLLEEVRQLERNSKRGLFGLFGF